MGATLAFRAIEDYPAASTSGAVLTGWTAPSAWTDPLAPRDRPPITVDSAESPMTAGSMPVQSLASVPEWLVPALSDLAKLRRSSSLPGAPSMEAISRMQGIVANCLPEFGLHPTSVDPSTEGGVCVSFGRAAKYADIEVLDSGIILAGTSEDGGRTRVWEIEAGMLQPSLAYIATFVGNANR